MPSETPFFPGVSGVSFSLMNQTLGREVPEERDRVRVEEAELRDLRLGRIRDLRTPPSAPSRPIRNSEMFTSPSNDLGQEQRDEKGKARCDVFLIGLA